MFHPKFFSVNSGTLLMQSDMELTEELDIILIHLEIHILYCSIWYPAEAFGILPLQLLHHLDSTSLLYLTPKFMPVQLSKQTSDRLGCRNPSVLEQTETGTARFRVAEKMYSIYV